MGALIKRHPYLYRSISRILYIKYAIVIYLRYLLPSTLCCLPVINVEQTITSRHCSKRGLQAIKITFNTGSLLHYLFTLTHFWAVYFLLHSPSDYSAWMLSSSMLFGVRTFLNFSIATIQPTTQIIVDYLLLWNIIYLCLYR